MNNHSVRRIRKYTQLRRNTIGAFSIQSKLEFQFSNLCMH